MRTSKLLVSPVMGLHDMVERIRRQEMSVGFKSGSDNPFQKNDLSCLMMVAKKQRTWLHWPGRRRRCELHASGGARPNGRSGTCRNERCRLLANTLRGGRKHP